ncbi:TPA: hypothetical protein DDW69_01440 [candidate division CPR2 bacterium]|uniref:Uncharacterized protein n=1 Tax=candidate division CPR2 bacterium GW2011_GWC1_41_48 TaxID=1618344 RepID=A0A0G0W9Q4_UNCC2|nr:MAG: hypothetical protein UT47_C0001G0090 [candidate division CPR2 bacterium GW2011_GWC2_39_35]KKR28258.1 MAG: hypothetical protein UT59_C0031G0005 [candidate division CPR2 bacterium GW2011_GWD1_39_7]KKS09685.1 MAG: hypothetical protein UU65_C0001G0090 [candidate division CPR2 bacterium GW2011_GWC1_41_48]OGB60453.1 MAG: hypothetical protein A2Y27_01335 [candidate division CPR2 bacterium GWD1_39_7]HBG81483.1 hypothetical protein [candidate division CPR2 bacterium]
MTYGKQDRWRKKRNLIVKVTSRQFEAIRHIFTKAIADGGMANYSLNELKVVLGLENSAFRSLIKALHMNKRLINVAGDEYSINHKKLISIKEIVVVNGSGSHHPTGKKWIGETGQFKN